MLPILKTDFCIFFCVSQRGTPDWALSESSSWWLETTFQITQQNLQGSCSQL